MRRRLVGGAAAAALLIATALPGCGSDGAAPDADAGAEAGEPLPATFDPTLGGPCVVDLECDDGIACTSDACDPVLGRCRSTPDDTACADASRCNGVERCVPRRGCVAGPVVTCDDGDLCTIDRCSENGSCAHDARDLDGDGDPDGHCAGGHDCDDADPAVHGGHVEVCGNHRDDDCDGQVDEEPCAAAANDTCATARAIDAAGTYRLSTIAAAKDYAPGCDVPSPLTAHDVVVAIAVPAGAHDVDVRAVAHDPAGDVAVSLGSACGAPSATCGHVAGAAEARALARSASGTLYAVITTQVESAVDVTVSFGPPTAPPANEDCTSPEPVALDTAFPVTLVDARPDLVSACPAGTGERTYAFTLPEPRDVRVYAATELGAGTPVVSLRAPGCTAERSCRRGETPPPFARALPAGTWVLGIAATAPIDASVVVRTSPATATPAEAACPTAPELAPGITTPVDLGAIDGAVLEPCLAGAAGAAYALTLDAPSDVLLVGRFAPGDTGALALVSADCPAAEIAACTKGAVTPLRLARRNLPAGSYRVLVGSGRGAGTSVTALVRPTTPPVTVTADGCATAFRIPADGGFFVGDTSTATADYGASCDALGQPAGSARDQLLALELPARRRVVLDMTGSLYTTLLDVRTGTCPGTEVVGGCSTQGATQAFRDLTLDPGTYWLQVDGFGGTSGAWNLDVRVLAP